MALETTVSYNSDISEVASAPQTLFDLVERIDKLGRGWQGCVGPAGR